MDIITGFHPVSRELVTERTFSLIGDEWMLITCADGEKHNSMTASWGALGTVWSVPSAIFFIRPQRHTYTLSSVSDKFALSFFGDKYRKELGSVYGKLNGGMVDKDAMAGLTAVRLPSGAVAYEEARLIFECRKMYEQRLDGDCFTDKSIPEVNYPAGDFHWMYVAEVVAAWVKDGSDHIESSVK